MFHPNIQVLEVIWLAIGVVGLLASTYNIYGAGNDWLWLRRTHQTNGRHTLAVATLVVESSRLIIQAIIVAIGILAMTIPPTPAEVVNALPENVRALTHLVEYGLVTIAVLLTSNTLVTFVVRRGIHVRS